jgi:hypothetical protein
VVRGTNGDMTVQGEAMKRVSACTRYIARAIPAHKIELERSETYGFPGAVVLKKTQTIILQID